jgi:hypothetical protein
VKENRARNEVVEAELNPFEHELNSSGKKCIDDCPACYWVRAHAGETL